MKSGIYQILNTATGDFYIGSSKDLIRRHKQHISSLKRNVNHSKILQRAWNKYGEIHFMFKVLATCPEEYLFKLEQWFVDNLKPKYNICLKDVSVPIGLDHQKYFDKEQYKKLALERLSNDPNFGWKSRIIEKIDENNNVIKEYSSLKEYAIEHNCAIGNVGKALKKGNKCKGFKIRYKEMP
jgi:hypothetical protein